MSSDPKLEPVLHSVEPTTANEPELTADPELELMPTTDPVPEPMPATEPEPAALLVLGTKLSTQSDHV